jgi:predicted nuclease with TOPRIM domain
MDVEAEIRDLKRRVGELEGSFGFLTGQLRDVHRSLLGFQEEAYERFDRLEGKTERLEGRVGRLETRFDQLDRKVDELPRALAEVVRAEFERRDRGA